MADERVMLIGGAGFIGSHLLGRLAARGAKVAVLDSFRAPASGGGPDAADVAELRWGYVRSAAAEVMVLDVGQQDALREAVSDWDPTRVVYLASLLAQDSETEWADALRGEIVGVHTALDAARTLAGLQRFLYVSSSFVYGGNGAPPLTEDMKPEPRGVYGVGKNLAEDIVHAFQNAGQLPTTIVRPAAVYGFGDSHLNSERITASLIVNAALGKSTDVRGADKKLDFTYVDDTVSGLELALFRESAIGETFNISRGCATSIRQFVEAVISASGSPVNIDESARASDAVRAPLATGKAVSLLGYSPQYDVASGVARAVERATSALTAREFSPL